MAPTKGRSKKQQASRKTATSVQLKCASGGKVNKRKITTNPVDVKASFFFQVMAPTKGRSKKQQASRKTATSVQLKCASGSKVNKRKITTNPVDVKAKSIRKTRSQKRNDTEQGTEAAISDSISKRARKGEKKVTEVLSTLKKDDENVADMPRATRRRGKNVEEARPIAAKKERAVRVRDVKSNNAATEARPSFFVYLKRRAKVAEEVPVDDTVREKVRRPARTATKETAEQIVKISIPRSTRMRTNVVAAINAGPKKKRKEATNTEEVIDKPFDRAVKTDQIVQKKRKTQKAKRVSVVRGKAPVGDQIEHSLKETESVAVSDGVKTSAKKPSAKKIVRRRTRKKEDAQPISVQDPISEKQVEESLTANSGLESNAKESRMGNAVEFQARTKEGMSPIAEQNAATKGQAEESMVADVGLESSAMKSTTRSAIEPQIRTKEGTSPIAEQDAAFEAQVKVGYRVQVSSEVGGEDIYYKGRLLVDHKKMVTKLENVRSEASDSDSCRFVCETPGKSLSVEVEESMTATAIVAGMQGDAFISQEQLMECKEGIPKEVLNDEPDVEILTDERNEIRDDVDISIPSDVCFSLVISMCEYYAIRIKILGRLFMLFYCYHCNFIEGICCLR
uniref:BRCT domain-containing protein n=1 Tax=Ascaris lumbricoides TaxID=6252 RepID=A0A0M3IJE7_ASCLU